MTNCRALALVIVFTTLVVNSSVQADVRPADAPPGVMPLIDTFILKHSQKRSPPALSIGIGKDGALVFAAGFGEATPGRQADAHTVYKIGSISKQFTAAAVLRMIEIGARQSVSSPPLDLDTPVANLVDGADAWKPDGSPPITLKNLLSMTSSLPNFTRRPPKNLDPWGAIPAHRLLGELKVLQPSGYPGSFEYSNTSYFLLSEILSTLHVPGGSRSYQGILRQEIFDKLGLHDTGFATDTALSDRLAKPRYNRKPAFSMPDWLQGSADLSSTVSDLFKWNKAVMDERLLGKDMRDAMMSDAARVDVWTYYGMGWFVRHKDGQDDYFHSGSVPGYTGFNLINRDRNGGWISVSILTNSDGIEGLDQLADDLVERLRRN